MIAGRAIEQAKEQFNNIHLEVEKQLVVNDPLDELINKRQWNVKPSQFSLNTTNPIRAIVEHLNVQPNPEKAFIPLSVGEFSIFKILCFFYRTKNHSMTKFLGKRN